MRSLMFIHFAVYRALHRIPSFDGLVNLRLLTLEVLGELPDSLASPSSSGSISP